MKPTTVFRVLDIRRAQSGMRIGVGEYIRDQIHANGMEAFGLALKRGYIGVFHHMSRKHLSRYVGEFADRHNDRPLGTLVKTRRTVRAK